ncbi:hypothetical protein REC12_08270 [Desulfosporosinus sp. PR]|uniref:hypothetical protein n=1 Tax=Candidatus Desulfosporosinus nitrosoreducens TaxID=3401928 RepID=UPI0027EF1BBD|nr:hypothetical protein [Desulfosporosinus sp. PR]MDQ7093581.1 hypothetical protein [Desulfosporosinus sp. PR]
MKIDYINGVIPKLAEVKGILTRYNDLIVKLKAEEAQAIPNFDNAIKLLKPLMNVIS